MTGITLMLNVMPLMTEKSCGFLLRIQSCIRLEKFSEFSA
jgi:hypothetical protein